MPVTNPQIRAAMAQREAQDTVIAQKVLAHHREAFRTRFPGQCEHALRLATERLQAILGKPEGTVLTDIATWPAPTEDIRNLAMAVESLFAVHQGLERAQWQADPRDFDDPAAL